MVLLAQCSEAVTDDVCELYYDKLSVHHHVRSIRQTVAQYPFLEPTPQYFIHFRDLHVVLLCHSPSSKQIHPSGIPCDVCRTHPVCRTSVQL